MQAAKVLLLECAEQERATPGGDERVGRVVVGQARGGDRRVPIVDRLLQTFGTLAKFKIASIIVLPIGN